MKYQLQKFLSAYTHRMQLPTLSVDAVQDKFVVCVVPEGVKDVGAVGAAVSAVPVLIFTV
jgi:hypothetical protein